MDVNETSLLLVLADLERKEKQVKMFLGRENNRIAIVLSKVNNAQNKQQERDAGEPILTTLVLIRFSGSDNWQNSISRRLAPKAQM